MRDEANCISAGVIQLKIGKTGKVRDISSFIYKKLKQVKMVNQPKCEQSQERSPKQSISARRKDSDPEADDGCLCQRWCSSRTKKLLFIKKLRDLVCTHFNPNSERELGAKGNAFHIIKLMKSLIEDVGQEWEEYKKIQGGSNPAKKMEKWLKSILDETKNTLDQENQLDKTILGAANKQTTSSPNLEEEERSDMSECEKEQIHILAAQIKMQRGEIRHFARILKEGIGRIEQIQPEQSPTNQNPLKKTAQNARRTRKKLIRQREEILLKMKNGMKLSKSEERVLEKKINPHLWNNCPDMRRCLQDHCWLTWKSGKCKTCRQTLGKCTCMSRLKNLVCTRCKEPGVKCGCDEEEIYGETLHRAKTTLELALQSYKGERRVNSVTELLSLVAGVAINPTVGSCSYDVDSDKWIESGFAPQPRGEFEWTCLETGTSGSTNFVLDSGSQLNMLKFEEVEKIGIKLEDLNTIFLTVNGITGTMADNWYRFRVKPKIDNNKHGAL